MVDFPTADMPKRPSEFFWLPGLDEIASWSRTITWLTDWPVIIKRHQFMPMNGQAPVKSRDGRMLLRDKPQRAICLGSPRKPFDGSFELELDPDGCERCKSIILPDGSSLHDCPEETDNNGNIVPWRYVFPIYVWEERMPYIISDAWFSRMVKSIIAERNAHTESPKNYGIKLTGYMDGRAKAVRTERVDLPGTFPVADPENERWIKIQDLARPFLTPERIVSDLGIGKFNPKYAPNAQPVSTDTFFFGGGVGTEEDPFADKSSSEEQV